MAIYQYLSQLLVLVVLIANLPFTIGASCNADNVLRAIRSEGEVGVLDCLYLFSIPVSEWKITYVFISTSVATQTFLSKTKTVTSPTTTIFDEVFSTHTEFTTTYVPYLPTYVSQYPEARVSSACSCIPLVITVTTTSYVDVSITVPGTLTITHYKTTKTTTISEIEYFPATTTVPAICYSSYLTLDFATAKPQRPVTTTTITPRPGTTTSDEDCCKSCFNAKNCLYWSNDPKAGCKIVLGTSKVADLVLSICPLGIQDAGGLSKPGATAVAYNPGPCMKADFPYLFAAPFN